MTPTSDERREVAERLRQMADAHDATEASRVACALELEYKVYGTVVAFDGADIRNLVDLIDPTCYIVPMGERLPHCSRCGQPILKPWPNFCPCCGARVVNGNGD